MARLRRTPPHELDPEARALYDKITSGPRGRFMVDGAGGLTGPFNAMLLSPAVGDPLQELGAAVRYRSRLTDRARELAILVVAGHHDSAFEQAAHEPIARTLGFTEEQLRALREGAPLALADPGEAAVLRVTRALVADGDLDDEEYAALGERELFELTTLVGYYATLALQLRVFRVRPSGPDPAP
ncbi:carboxymuconolactone decarboxylase family protein [Nonomuraea candida]|uniref:carboxymuconolactone decarboxylase family protein n=1 Tax=Nonomuraea candida TaxID=359159 RepID=UPI0005BC75FE|nr:carboxymuconolactone decarboxylase family protein [Nonomuraea candida]